MLGAGLGIKPTLFEAPHRDGGRRQSAENFFANELARMAERLAYAGDVAYREIPVSPMAWVHDPYFVGGWADDKRGMWPEVKRAFVEAYRQPRSVLSGSTSVGKTSVAVLIFAYLIYDTWCMANVHAALGVAEGSPLYICFASINRGKAKKTGFKKFQAFMKRSSWFQEKCKPVNPEAMASNIEFPHGVIIEPIVSSSDGVLGQDVIGLHVDESNEMEVIEDSSKVRGVDTHYDQAEDIFVTGLNRMENRFLHEGRRFIPRCVLSGSNKYPDDFLNRHKLQVRQENAGVSEACEVLKGPDQEPIGEVYGKLGVFIWEPALWQVKPEGTYSKETFEIEVGGERHPSRILYPGDTSREGARVIRPPVTFLPMAKRDLEKFLRDTAGIAILSEAPLIGNRTLALRPPCVREPDPSHKDACECDPCLGTKHPYSAEETFLTDGHQLLRHYLARQDEKTGRWIPRVNPDVPRAVHIDASINQDFTGIGIWHPTDVRPVQRTLPDGTKTGDLAYHYYADFMLRVRTPPEQGGTISYLKIRDLIYEFVSIGFRIGSISMDGFQSKYLLEEFEAAGFNTLKVSMDLEPGPYLELRSAIMEGRASYYYYPPFVDELLKLQFDPVRKKIDHPKRDAQGRPGRKDVTDGSAGAIHAIRLKYHDWFDPQGSEVSVQVFGGDEEF